MSDEATPAEVRLNAELGQMLDSWANCTGHRFVNRSSGQRTADTVSRESLLDLMQRVQAAERKRCARLCEAAEDATTSAREAEVCRRLAHAIRA